MLSFRSISTRSKTCLFHDNNGRRSVAKGLAAAAAAVVVLVGIILGSWHDLVVVVLFGGEIQNVLASDEIFRHAICTVSLAAKYLLFCDIFSSI